MAADTVFLGHSENVQKQFNDIICSLFGHLLSLLVRVHTVHNDIKNIYFYALHVFS